MPGHCAVSLLFTCCIVNERTEKDHSTQFHYGHFDECGRIVVVVLLMCQRHNVGANKAREPLCDTFSPHQQHGVNPDGD